ncbi:hypothetical protein Taro_028995 [Colocasia esculenta]|uniref:Box C/D snoRNA protein 1 n=1 Tax=Colocasia esculenta TaxID=4460 RepID=A0A843VCQ4_COLES|nr:hypothetical protein [Colocasia esculenta]
MGGEEGPSSPDAVTSPLCEECGESPWKYRCPGCSIRTCSLPCVKSHKQRSGCTGQRDRSHFVPLSQFDDNQILSDYNLLEETKRAAEAARRMRCLFGGQPGGTRWRPGRFGGHPCFKLPFKLRMLRNAAFRRKARLLLQPTGMSKREKNQSRYDQRFIAHV